MTKNCFCIVESPNIDKDKNRFVSQSQITVADKSKRMDEYRNNDATSCRTASFSQ